MTGSDTPPGQALRDSSSLTVIRDGEQDRTQTRLPAFVKHLGESGTPSSTDRDSGCSEKGHQPNRDGGEGVMGNRSSSAGVP